MPGMMKKSVIVLGLVSMAGTASAFSTGPFDALTGAPGEGLCTSCHTSFPVNSGAGSLEITLPEAYEPGLVYDVTVTLADPDAVRWGFELTVIETAGETFAGALTPQDAATQVSTGGLLGRTYVKHTLAGTATGTTGSNAWTFSWTAPPEGTGSVAFYAAGNGANNNAFSSGDRIYAVSAPLDEAVGTSVAAPMPVVALSNAPNPFNPATEVSFELTRSSPVRLSVYALDGRRVAVIHDGMLDAGGHTFTWRGTDGTGRGAPSGQYLLRLEHGEGVETRRMLLLR